MTNYEIIVSDAIANGLYTEAEVNALHAAGKQVPVHTVQRWNQLGYRVKSGEKTAFISYLWKVRTGKNDKTAAAAEDADNSDLEISTESRSYYKAKANMFDIKQVVRADEVKPTYKIKTPEEIAAYNAKLAADRRAAKAAREAAAKAEAEATTKAAAKKTTAKTETKAAAKKTAAKTASKPAAKTEAKTTTKTAAKKTAAKTASKPVAKTETKTATKAAAPVPAAPAAEMDFAALAASILF